MDRKRIVIALGGNALGKTPDEQLRLARGAAKSIVDLIEAGGEVVITHGNGPQVGMINLGMGASAQSGVIPAEMPFAECGAMSQGYIGYHLQNSIANELHARGIHKEVAAVVTQVAVDRDDPAFRSPSKPVGAFYTYEQAQALAADKGYCMRQDAGRGWRRMVASPQPVDILEKKVIRSLVEQGNVVIAAGGGGIPVVRRDGRYVGVPAVIDKDLAAAKLAKFLDADMLLILTAVEHVVINWGKPNQIALHRITADEAVCFCAQGQFAPGSMLPKIQAAVEFAQCGKKAVIASLDRALEAVRGQSGTVILPAPRAQAASA
ncbi:carbamate kinase [Anaerotruncus rubiinfantis]|uniref:carbamate kinase n=1 Tax=Anaerotruncus rubiinfantis TaxID=1720200 RepID=UPI0034A56A1E